MKRILLLSTILCVLLVATALASESQINGVPFWLSKIVSKINEIRDIIIEIKDKVSQKECSWEKINQIITENDIIRRNFCENGECSEKLFFYLPKDGIFYEEIKVSSARAIVSCPIGIQVCEYYINGIKCASSYINAENYGISLCTDAFKSGMNEISGQPIHELFLELEIKPANC